MSLSIECETCEVDIDIFHFLLHGVTAELSFSSDVTEPTAQHGECKMYRHAWLESRLKTKTNSKRALEVIIEKVSKDKARNVF